MSLSQPPSLTTLPGELRNQIFNLCIDDALTPPLASPLTATIFSPSQESGHLILSNNRGPLPLLFTSKSIFSEVLSLTYARVHTLEIGRDIKVWLDEDAISRWDHGFKIAAARPEIFKSVRNIEVTMPRTPPFKLASTYAGLRQLPKGSCGKNAAVAVLPSLEEFLKKFEKVEKVKVVFVAQLGERHLVFGKIKGFLGKIEGGKPPEYESLGGLWRVLGERLSLGYSVRWFSGFQFDRGAMATQREWLDWQQGWVEYAMALNEKSV